MFRAAMFIKVICAHRNYWWHVPVRSSPVRHCLALGPARRSRGSRDPLRQSGANAQLRRADQIQARDRVAVPPEAVQLLLIIRFQVTNGYTAALEKPKSRMVLGSSVPVNITGSAQEQPVTGSALPALRWQAFKSSLIKIVATRVSGTIPGC